MLTLSGASAYSNLLSSFNQHYNTDGTELDSCDICHTGSNGGSLDPYGRAYSANGRNFASIEELDSDGDGFTNLEEIEGLTFPGDASDAPDVPELISEPTVNESDTISDEHEEYEEEEEEDEEHMEEPASETSSEKQSPGFEMVFAIASMLSVTYLNGRK